MTEFYSNIDDPLKEFERKDFDYVFGRGIKILTGVKGEPLTNLERTIFRKCVEDSYSVIPEDKQNFESLGNAAEDLFYMHYFGLSGYLEIPGVSKEDISKYGWSKCLGKYWRNRKEGEFVIPQFDDPYHHDDHYYMSPEEEGAMRQNKMELDAGVIEQRKKLMYEKYKDERVFVLYERVLNFLVDYKVGEGDGSKIHKVNINLGLLRMHRTILEDRNFSGTLGDLVEVRGGASFLDILLGAMAMFNFH